MAVELACRLTALPRAIARHYGGIGPAAVSTIRRKVREGRRDVGRPLTAILRKLNLHYDGLPDCRVGATRSPVSSKACGKIGDPGIYYARTANIIYLHKNFLPGAEYRNGERLWQGRSDQVLTDDYHTNVKTLLGATLVRECSHAAAILGAEARRSVVSRECDERGPTGDGLREMLCLAEARAAIRFALGTLLGRLADVDDAARERDRRSLTPRPYLLSSLASAEQIAGLIRIVEQTFGDLGDKDLQPEYVVNCLANAIEGLAKELWPKEFDQGS